VTKRFLHVGFNFEGTIPPINEMEKTFNLASDWIRYNLTGWVLYTGASMEVWRDRIHNIEGMDKNISFLIVEFDQFSGYQEEWVWEWLQKDRTPSFPTGQVPQVTRHDPTSQRTSRE
jgi:hypothetical protein